MTDVCCLVLRGVIESRDDGAPHLERDRRVWYRVTEGPRVNWASHMGRDAMTLVSKEYHST